MTAGMTTRSMEGSRISLPRAGLGALLAGTLLAGSLLGAAAYAGIAGATSNPAAALAAPLPESAAIRHARIQAGNGQLAGDAGGIQANVTTNQGPIRAIPYRGDGFGGDGFVVRPGNDHATGHGPLR